MLSTFELITRSVVQELDRKGNLIPLESLIDADKFHCCFLVYKRESFFPFFKPRYCKTGLTMDDLLESQDEHISTEVKKRKKYGVEENAEKKMNISLKLPQSISLEVNVDCNKGYDLQLQHFEISEKGKESLQLRKLKEEQPSLVQALKEKGKNLYIVVETVEMTEEQKVHRKYFLETLFQVVLEKIKLYNNNSCAVTIPSKSVLAFRTNLLVFEKECCRIFYSDDKNSFSLESGSGSRSGQTEEPSQPLQNFNDLQMKLMDLNGELQDLEKDQRKNVLDSLVKHLKEGTLKELEERVMKVLLTEELDDSKDPVLSILFSSGGSFMAPKGDAILGFLQALIELKEERQMLLAVAVEEKLLSETMTLVKNILNQTSEREPKPFSLKADSIPHILVIMCDPEYQEDKELKVTWNSEACHLFCALYIALSVLLLLA
ncbi:gasdermin-B isoform X1 [Monodelphis domestica]|uniref:gasdermin-B isoform X1 n=2 Tax=Monodelphis domestica TaxID=13616 RepID=UPI0024E1D3FB|nr:gasdermin-B isoform X1 [Monodelphis domestica]XP_016285970.2 gasdermin-B isoform X1 [Monodelphis domestica]